MLNHTEGATASFEGCKLQTKTGFTVLHVVGGVQSANVVENTASFTAYKQHTLVGNFRISCLVEHRIQEAFQLSEVGSAASVEHVRHSVGAGVVVNVADNVDQSIHSADRLTIANTTEFLTEEQSSFNALGMESSTVLTGFRFSGVASNHLSSTNRVRDCPAIAENLSQVSDTPRGDVQRNRTNRCFFVSITHHECWSADHSSGSSATDTATYLNNGIRDNSFNKHVLFGGVIQLQNHTGNDRFSGVHSETGFSCGSNCGAKHNVREQC